MEFVQTWDKGTPIHVQICVVTGSHEMHRFALFKKNVYIFSYRINFYFREKLTFKGCKMLMSAVDWKIHHGAVWPR